jgi:hypothetical protein
METPEERYARVQRFKNKGRDPEPKEGPTAKEIMSMVRYKRTKPKVGPNPVKAPRSPQDED